jgi:hypothetical protein
VDRLINFGGRRAKTTGFKGLETTALSTRRSTGINREE